MLFGTSDFAIPPESLDGYEPYADDMRIETVPDTGHFIVDAVPELVARRALEFFEAR
jgi:pimeloyl-ACP methyl ester carboxylesterase